MDRALDKWSRPDPFLAGFSRAIGIWVPTEDVIALPNDKSRERDVIWVEPADPGEAVYFEVAIGRPNQGSIHMRGGRPLAGFHTSDGQMVLLLVMRETVTEEHREQIELKRVVVARKIQGQSPNLMQSATARAVMYGEATDPSGPRVFYGFALNPQEGQKPWKGAIEGGPGPPHSR